MNDEAIMLLVSKDDLSKAALLFDRYNVMIYNYYMRNTLNKMISQDLTQNVFHRIIKYRKSFREEYNFKPWIFRIARNVLIDHAKEEKKYYGDEINDDKTLDSFHENYLEKTEKSEREKILHNALNKLDDDDKEILILSKFQQIKYKEIAQIMNLTESAIKVKVHRAIKKLRETYFQLENV
jgi:RNA polymerase sigma-70 factor, ECF subfamily